MKKLIGLFIVAVLISGGTAIAQDEHEHLCHEFPSGRDFGQHVSKHAQAGHFDGEMNPGVHHQGYSPCTP